MSHESADPSDPTELLAHLSWVQRLARALVRDAAGAEDVAQEAVCVTLSQPGGKVDGAHLRGWLAGVVRRLSRDRSRSEESRSRREQESARSQALPAACAPAAFEVVARGERQQRVARAVMELAEPYRSTVLYRYLDQLSTRDVAARMEVSEPVVRKRLSRGLEQLRARLDGEFGAPTANWAGALLLPAGAGLSGAAVTIPGVLIVGTKVKLAVAAIVIAGALVTWRTFGAGDRLPARSDVPAAATAPVESARDPTIEPQRALDGGSNGAPVETLPPAATPDGKFASAGTLLRVTVRDAQEQTCTRGRLVCFWDEADEWGERGAPHAPRVLEAAIAGETTELHLPAHAGRAKVAASVDGQPPAQETYVDQLRQDAGGAAITGLIVTAIAGLIVRDVVVHVGASVAGPRLTGAIRVDGEQRVPLGLAIQLEAPEREAHINAITARYAVGPCVASQDRLWVTSLETVPHQFTVDLPEDGDAAFDVDLATERTLTLTVLERRTGRPLPGVELWRTVDVRTERRFLRQTWRGHSMFVVTDRDGKCVLGGLPLEGSVSVRRDASTVEAEFDMVGGTKQKFQTPREPLFELRLTRKMSRELAETIRIDADGRLPRIRGRVAERLLAARADEAALEVHYGRVEPDGRAQRSDIAVAVDAGGGFSFEAGGEGSYRLWAERGRLRLSKVVTVQVEGGDPAPVELPPRGAGEVLLRLVHCPSQGVVSIAPEDEKDAGIAPFSATIALTGVDIERHLFLDRALDVALSIGGGEPGDESSRSQRLRLDPASQGVVEVDLGGNPDSNLRPLTIELVGATPANDAILVLWRPDPPVGKASTAVVVLAEGRSTKPLALVPGRYAFLSSNLVAGLVAGVVDVTTGSAGEPLKLRCELVERRRADFGAGLRLDAAGGVDLTLLPAAARSLRFASRPDLATRESLFVPVGATVVSLAE